MCGLFDTEKIEMLRKRPANVESHSNELTAATTNQKAVNSCGRRLKKVIVGDPPQQPQQQQQQKIPIGTMHSAQAAVTPSSAPFPTASERAPTMKYWQDELMEFSVHVTRQVHFTLDRIAYHFRSVGTKFDTNFRNHFLYIANNR